MVISGVSPTSASSKSCNPKSGSSGRMASPELSTVGAGEDVQEDCDTGHAWPRLQLLPLGRVPARHSLLPRCRSSPVCSAAFPALRASSWRGAGLCFLWDWTLRGDGRPGFGLGCPGALSEEKPGRTASQLTCSQGVKVPAAWEERRPFPSPPPGPCPRPAGSHTVESPSAVTLPARMVF